ncbi:MAG: hypothetical protein AAF541_23975 [Pseudomonadota bacterium]
MIELLLAASLALGLSESIETRLPQDPGMIYTVGFKYQGVKVGLDWKNRGVVAERVCRKSSSAQRSQCQAAALNWLNAECTYYGDKKRLNGKQQDMQRAVCNGAQDLGDLISARQVAER